MSYPAATATPALRRPSGTLRPGGRATAGLVHVLWGGWPALVASRAQGFATPFDSRLPTESQHVDTPLAATRSGELSPLQLKQFTIAGRSLLAPLSESV